MEPIACCVTLVDENERLLRKICRLKSKLKLTEKRLQETEEKITNDDSTADDYSSMNPNIIANNSRGHVQISTSDESERVKKVEENFHATKAKLLAMQNNTTRLLHAEQHRCRELEAKFSDLESANKDLATKLDEEKRKVFSLERQIGQLENETCELKSKTVKSLKSRCEKLTSENEALKRELNSFEPEFFEELEDMKYELKRSKELNLEYEKAIRVLCEKYKLPFIKIS